MNAIHIGISLDQILCFYAKRCLKGRLLETTTDTAKDKVIFELAVGELINTKAAIEKAMEE